MKDLRSEWWLWFKGIAFACVAVLSFLLIWIEIKSSKQIVLLLVAIWAFCRTYYFAFYVIEKYIDPRFRFAGLIYLPQYVASRLSNVQELDSTTSSKQETPPLSWWVYWPYVFLIADVVVPAVYNALEVDRWPAPLATSLTTLMYVAGAVQIAYLAIWTTYAPVSMRFRWPIGMGLVWLSVLFTIIGAGFHEVEEASVLTIVLTIEFSVMVFGFHVISFFVRKRLQYTSALQGDQSKRTINDQFTLRDVLVYTTAVATLFGIIQFFPRLELVTWTFFQDREFLLTWSMFMVLAIFLGLLTQAILGLVVGQLSRKETAWLAVYVALLIVAFPIFSMWLEAGMQNALGGSIFQWGYFQWGYLYLFVAAFSASLICIFMHGRRCGLAYVSFRLADSKDENHALETAVGLSDH